MENGWIKLHRKLLDNPIIKKPNYLSLWIVLLLKANHKDKKFMWNNNIIVVKEGQMITGRKELSLETGIPETTIERVLEFLEKTNQIGQQKTTKYRLITIINWKDYQNSDNKRTTNGQQTDTNKNDNNVKKEKNNISENKFSHEGADLIKSFESINPSVKRMYGNKTQRQSCEDLISTYGFERVKMVIEKTLPKTNKMTSQFFPNISTPLQLFEKWQKLEDAIYNYQKKSENKTKVAF